MSDELEHLNWLEELASEPVSDWVADKNRSIEPLILDPRFDGLIEELQSETTDVTPPFAPKYQIAKGFIYRAIVDAESANGRLERMAFDDIGASIREWERVFDVDEVARDNAGSYMLSWPAIDVAPDGARILVSLSVAGAGETVIIEHILKGGGGAALFKAPASKAFAKYLDNDRIVFCSSDESLGGATPATLPSTLRLWTRESESSVEIAKLPDAAMGFLPSPTVALNGAPAVTFAGLMSPYEASLYLVDHSGALSIVTLPANSDPTMVIAGSLDNQAVMILGAPIEFDGEEIPADTIISFDLPESLRAGTISGVRIVRRMAVNETVVRMSGIGVGAGQLALTVLRDVKSYLETASLVDGDWHVSNNEVSDPIGTIGIAGCGDEAIVFSYESFLTPPRYTALRQDGTLAYLDRRSTEFEPEQFRVRQHFAKSADGTDVPYFIIAKKNIAARGPMPTVLTGYGGFQLTFTASYNLPIIGPLPRIWLSRGGAVVVGGMRGGGEYGADWHSAAIQEKRHKTFEDVAAICDDLISRKYSEAKKIGVIGGSNGGLLSAVSATRYPDFFGAAVAICPVIDMIRFPLHYQGPIWTGEYGDPNSDQAMRDYLKSYSPLHNLREDRNYPDIFLLTATNDDNVHPSHARKMAARMAELNHSFVFLESATGGHALAQSPDEKARTSALQIVFLMQRLMDSRKSTVDSD